MKQLFLLSAGNPNKKIYFGLGILVLLGVSIFYYFSYQKISQLEKKFEETKALSEKLEASIKEISGEKKETVKEEKSMPAFSQEEQKIGEKIEELKIKSIRTGDHLKFFRVVFDLEKLDGKDPEKIPETVARYLKEEKKIEIEISGLAGDLGLNPAVGKEVGVKDPVVNSYVGEVIADVQKIKYKISLKKETGFLLDYRLNPARIVLDIEK